ncbi:MAG: hypothetical protein KDC54_03110 [Lewinella sp.]|nr:hypothetical protein [Lewinella sp.]
MKTQNKYHWLLAIPFFFALLLSGCSREIYKTAGYDAYAPSHHVIAVLPVKTITTGRIPEEWTDEVIKEIEENESQAFQIALFDEISERSGVRANEVGVTLQHYSETNALLGRAGIGIRESWDMPPTELADALGVDAVVRAVVRKDMFLTDMESFGLDMARTALAIFTEAPWWMIPGPKTSDVYVSSAIIDGGSGTVIWNTEKVKSTDWNKTHPQIVRDLARVMARRFPYRD